MTDAMYNAAERRIVVTCAEHDVDGQDDAVGSRDVKLVANDQDTMAGARTHHLNSWRMLPLARRLSCKHQQSWTAFPNQMLKRL